MSLQPDTGVCRSEGQVRGRTVQITGAGVAVAAAVRQERAACLAKRFDGLLPEDLAVLESALAVLGRIFDGPLNWRDPERRSAPWTAFGARVVR